MAVSNALAWQLNNGGSAADLYDNIRTFLAASPDAATTQAAMAQYGISGEDVANATGGKSGGLLEGNILAGASWNSLNTTLGDQLTQATGQATSNYAVGGATTADTLNQLNTYLAGGGQFDPNATVYLQTGGVDFITGIDKDTVKSNINQIVKTLGDQGVNVVLTGSPYAKSIDDVINNNFDTKVDQIFTDIAKENKNVALVGVQGEILQNKNLLVDALHTNAEGTAIYNQAVIDSLSQFKNEVPSSTPQAIAQVQKTNTVATTPAVITQAAASPVVAQSLSTQTQNQTIQNLISSGAFEANQNNPILINGTYYQPIYSQTGSGMDAQQGPLENVVAYNANENKVGGNVNYYSPTGDYIQTTQQQDVNANKDFMNFVLTAATMGGLPAGIGEALGLTGSTARAVGQGLLTTGTQLGGGASVTDALKAGLLGGGLVYGGSQLADYISANTPVNAANMTQAQFNDAIEGKLVSDMQAAGLSKDQINAFLDDMGIGQGVATTVAQPDLTTTPSADTVNVTGLKAPTTLNNLLSTISTIPTVNVTGKVTPEQVDQSVLNSVASQLALNKSTIPTVNVTGTKPQQVSQDIIDAVTTQLATSQATTPTVNVTAQKPTTVNDVIAALATTGFVSNIPTVSVTSNRPITSKADLDSVISSLVTTSTIPAATSTIPTTTITAQKPTTVGDTLATLPATLVSTPATTTTTPTKETDPLKVAQLALAAAGLLGAGSALSSSGTPTGFDVVPIPASFVNPPAPSVAPYRPLAPINFGNRNLLMGTQWEKFLDPNYGQVPAPVQYSQPSNLSYNDLMGILGSKQGMPSRSSLSINDVISGIQNQY